MSTEKNRSVLIVRIVLAVLAVLPFFYLNQFAVHFRAYLTGTIINDLVRNEWGIAMASILFFSLFLVPLSYRRRAKWAQYSIGAAFFISLFVEMYGLPLTVLLAAKYFFKPDADLPPVVVNIDFLGVGLGLDHAMVYAAAVMAVGLGLIAVGWWTLYRSVKRADGLARTGLYRVSRHPQYLGFILVITGWFIGWPTILTLFLSPILIYKYWRAARAEERDMIARYDQVYRDYMAKTPFIV